MCSSSGEIRDFEKYYAQYSREQCTARSAVECNAVDPGYDVCSVCCATNIYSGHRDLGGHLPKTDGKWQDTTGRSRPLPFTGPGIIVDDEKNISHRHHRIAEGFASQSEGKKLEWIVRVCAMTSLSPMLLGKWSNVFAWFHQT